MNSMSGLDFFRHIHVQDVLTNLFQRHVDVELNLDFLLCAKEPLSLMHRYGLMFALVCRFLLELLNETFKTMPKALSNDLADLGIMRAVVFSVSFCHCLILIRGFHPERWVGMFRPCHDWTTRKGTPTIDVQTSSM